MDFGNVRSLTIGGKAVSRLLVGDRLVWKKAEPGPAYDYEVEYLEADGTQYVLNAFEMDFDTISVSKVYVRARFFQVEDPPSGTLSVIFFGSVGRLSFGVFKPNGTSSGTSAIKYGNNATVILGDSVSAHDIEVGFEGESYYSVFDGVRTDHADWSTRYGTTIVPMGILCRGSASGGPAAVYPSRIRVYSLSCNVADLIPVVKDGRPCFYNKLNGEFLYSSSGVDFIAGPKVVPKTPYIQTDGQSYMDLGFVPSTALDYEISLRIAEPAGAVAYLFGTVSDKITAARYKMAETATQITLLTPSIMWGDYDRSIENAMQRHTYALRGDYYLIDGVEYPAKNVGSAPTGSMHIGHCVVGAKGSIACFYYAKFWESGVLIRDLVPYSGTRGVGLLDKVHDVLYTNAGGGTLTYGYEVDEKYAFVQTKGLADSFWAAPISQL